MDFSAQIRYAAVNVLAKSMLKRLPHARFVILRGENMLDSTRLRNKKLFDKVVSADDAALLIEDGMTVGTSGFTPAGYPKAVPLALAKQVENGRQVKITLWTGSSVGPELDNELARVNAIARRAPMIRYTQKHISARVNSGEVAYTDIHLGAMASQVECGHLGEVDIAIVEALAITPEGHVIPTTSVGNMATFAKMAKKVIVEVNTAQPLCLEGMHDIYMPNLPPCTREVPIFRPGDRIGTPYVEVGLDKIAAIVESDRPDPTSSLVEPDAESERIAGYLLDFLAAEVKAKRLPPNLLPLQSGVGNINNAVLMGLKKSSLENLEFYSELLQPAAFDMIEAGKVKMASATCFTPDPSVLERFCQRPDYYRERIVLRPVAISNCIEVIRRLGVIALNTPIEVDIYGQVNSTHLMGTRMMNAIGGSGDFARNAYLSVFTTTSTTKEDKVSRIVPMVTHADHTEHDWHVLITEQGVADLRGLSPRERARSIIENCAHPKYKDILLDYYKRAAAKGGHSPHILAEAFALEVRLEETGSMLP